MILKKEAIESISNKLCLKFTGIEQDWDVEFANPDKLNEYLSFYQKNENNLSEDEKFALMALIWASYDDYLSIQEKEKVDFWNRIKELVASEQIIFSDLIKYWSVENEKNSEMFYHITPLARNLKTST